jgi:hypothetical protein
MKAAEKQARWHGRRGKMKPSGTWAVRSSMRNWFLRRFSTITQPIFNGFQCAIYSGVARIWAEEGHSPSSLPEPFPLNAAKGPVKLPALNDIVFTLGKKKAYSDNEFEDLFG